MSTLGGMVETFEVAPDANALAAAGLTVADLASAINAGNRNDGAGRLPPGRGADRARDRRHPQSRGSVGGRCPFRGDGRCARWDVATVRIGALTRYGAVTRNGKGEAVEGW
jgi:cobalt-zinc-cadmium resistance protein CzcA